MDGLFYFLAVVCHITCNLSASWGPICCGFSDSGAKCQPSGPRVRWPWFMDTLKISLLWDIDECQMTILIAELYIQAFLLWVSHELMTVM